jgi:RHS repeat-associated protein
VQERQGDLSYLGLNPHSDISFAQDTSGDLRGVRLYDPYGGELSDTFPDCSLGFQGDYEDPASGLVWMGARWYSPSLARFVSEDPVPGSTSDPLTLNPYLYCKGDPINAFDPTGESFWSWLKDTGKKIAGAVATAFKAVGSAFKAVGRAAKRAVSAIGSAVRKVGRAVKKTTKKVVRAVKNAVSWTGRTAKKTLDAARKAWTSFYNEKKWYHHSNLWAGLRKAPEAAAGFCAGLGTGVYNTVKGTATGIYNLATGKISLGEFASGIKQSFSGTWGKLTDFDLAARDPYAYAKGIGEITGSIEAGIAMSAALKYVFSNYVSPALHKAYALVVDKLSESSLGSRLLSAFSGEGGYIGLGGGVDDVAGMTDDVAAGGGNSYYHSASPEAVDPIIEGGFKTDLPSAQEAWANNRYGRGSYLSDTPETALAERPGGTIIEAQADIGKNLDITDRGILDYDTGHNIARGARKHGYDSITYQSARLEGGINTVVFDPSRVVLIRVLP